jgi:hypothetical protein
MLYQLSYAHQILFLRLGLFEELPSDFLGTVCERRARQESNLRPAA